MYINDKKDRAEHYDEIQKQVGDNKACQIHRREDFNCSLSIPSKRREGYKISLVVKGSGTLFYGDQCLQIKPNCLLFLSPNIPYAWYATTEEQTGFFLTFAPQLLTNNRHQSLLSSQLFKNNTSPVYSYPYDSHTLLTFFFEQLLIEQGKKHKNGFVAIQNYVELIINQGDSLIPTSVVDSNESSSILPIKFFDLLEQQYNDEKRGGRPQDYADKLSVHVNHLNRLLKTATGKTTQQHIIERRMLEAKTQLRQSKKRISEIAYGLGFSHSSSFNHFFIKHQNVSPKVFRHTWT